MNVVLLGGPLDGTELEDLPEEAGIIDASKGEHEVFLRYVRVPDRADGDRAIFRFDSEMAWWQP